MSKQDNLTDFLTDVADAIREKKGTTEKINPQNFSDEIRSIEGGGGSGNAEIEYADETVFGKDSYKNVVIDEGVVSIGDYSFYNAKNVENVTLPSTLESIGDRCFAYSTIRDINLNDNIKSIGTYAFSRCPNLKRYVHPRGIDTVPERVCDYCTGLEYVYFPNTVKTVNPYAFFGNNSKGIFIAEDVESWINIEFKGPSGQMSNPNSYIANCYFGSVDSIVEDISIESMSFGVPLFRNFKNIKNVRFSENLQSLLTHAFNSSSIVSVELGGCTSIGSSVFYNCDKLESIDISNVTNIADKAFYYCTKLKVPIKFNPAVVSIKTYTFFNCIKVPYFDFREHTTVPTLESTYTFLNTNGEFVVPDSLYDEWIAATNWSSLASRIVKASEYVEPIAE